ncbi:MAG: HAD-IA family hydrolase [Paraprevotella sp.]|nr:HAD-IA family hydrolase [Paraprevotella sp.]
METGRISSDDFYQWVCRTIGHHLERESVFAAWNCMLTGIPMERLRLIRRIKRDYHTYMLSNTNVLHWDYACQQLLSPAGAKLMREEVFDRIFLSFELHLAKPDPEIFLTVCDQADLLPSETFFIEDSAENCRAAQRLGMQVFHSREAEDWFGLFKEYGGEGIS